MDKQYRPQQYERQTYQLWEQSGAFTPGGETEETFSIVMPPPNANGDLHMGHALTIAIEDTITRYQRMLGKDALYLPGADHAGFETQVVYERKLEQEGKSRFDYSRDELYKQIYDFVQSNKTNMEEQVRSLGASCDWSRNTFTLDQNIIKGTYRTFKKLWDDGLVYRSQRIVNYCTHHDTSFSDLEVDYREEKGKLWQIRYPLENGEGEVVVATTRPETMLGDTAVAVHPDDERYQKLIGQSIHLPLAERPIPIVADSGVDPDFGTGAVKVTPAHDQLDFEIGQRHHLPIISVIGTNGHITDQAPLAYHHLSVSEAREKVVEDLKEKGFLVDEKRYKHSVGICYKCGIVIEPLVRDQWLVNVKPLAEDAIKTLDEGEIDIYPKSKRKVLRNWFANLQDWNISRQIAWGIPIPAFVNAQDPDDWIFSEKVDQETLHIDGKTYHRDPDVFDTWFSSGQWPFNTLGYPDHPDFERFYPNTLMETGADILFWWVSRMIMLGLYVTGEVPFRQVYLHGMVLDEQGQKMSKSKGNVIAPQAIQDQYGSDALRAGLISGRAAGANQAFDSSKVIAGRNFANKLWNVARFVTQAVGEDYRPEAPEAASLADEWILDRINQSTGEISKNLDRYRLSQAWERVYELLWDDFADWYVEAGKLQPNHHLLVHGLETILKLTHPFTPFVSEAIWQQLPWTDGLLINQTWPEANKVDREATEDFERLRNLIKSVRAVTNELDDNRFSLYFKESPLLEQNAEMVTRLAGLVACEQVSDGRGLPIPGTSIECWLDADENTVEQYKTSLESSLEETQQHIERLQAKLDNKGYRRNAPKEVVAETEHLLKDAQNRSQALTEQLKSLG